MGMFDTIYCRQPLPGGWRTDEEFQSKSLHNALCFYEIGADGRLREMELDEQGHPASGKGKDTGFHGVMRFYTYSGTEYKEFEAKFSDGLLADLRPGINARYDERGMLVEKDTGR